MRVFGLTALALICFAANSILCRLALAQRQIDPASFTLVRLGSGALFLGLLVLVTNKNLSLAKASDFPPPIKLGAMGNWPSGLMLFVYAAAFSFAYVGLSAGTGALILFGAVQVTMISGALLSKHRLSAFEWCGLVLALAGLVYLVLPGLSAPPLERAALMMSAGVAWGVYSLRGRAVKTPVPTTAGNFVRATPFAIIIAAVFWSGSHFSSAGLTCAMASGALTSGLGYVIWYAVVPSLGATRAAVAQLLVPILAAGGGGLVLGEHLTWRLGIAAAVILSGISLSVMGRR